MQVYTRMFIQNKHHVCVACVVAVVLLVDPTADASKPAYGCQVVCALLAVYMRCHCRPRRATYQHQQSHAEQCMAVRDCCVASPAFPARAAAAGVIALDLARELLELHPNKIALVVSHENM